jgi:uridine kinase
MTKWAPAKIDTLDALAAEILSVYGRGRIVVAIDGLAGTTAFAADLAESLSRAGHQVFTAAMDDFRHPRVIRYAAGSDAPEAGYDLDSFKRALLDPFRDAGTGSFVLAAFDAARDTPIEPKWMTAKPDSILLVHGAFLLTPELRGMWNYTIWVETPSEPSKEQAAYVKRLKPRALATAIIDNADAAHPRRSFADSC